MTDPASGPLPNLLKTVRKACQGNYCPTNVLQHDPDTLVLSAVRLRASWHTRVSKEGSPHRSVSPPVMRNSFPPMTKGQVRAGPLCIGHRRNVATPSAVPVLGRF